MKIIASATMLKEHLTRKRAGKVPNNVIPLPPIPEATAERVRVRRVRLEMQGNPRAYRQQTVAAYDGEPTPEWRSKHGGAIETRQTGSDIRKKGYQTRSPFDQNKEKYASHHQLAVARFLQDAAYAERSTVVDLNRIGGQSDPSSRLGGLGGVPQCVRDGYARHQWVWAELPVEMQATARTLILQTARKANNQPYSVEDVGALILPTLRTKDVHKGSGLTAIWALASVLVKLYQVCPVRVTTISAEERLLEATR